MAMPPTGALSGTPASCSARVEPQTEPIDDEPFDSSVSETIRIVYGNSSSDGIIGSSALWASAPWPMSRGLGPRLKPGSPAGEGGEVEGGMYPRVGFAGRVVSAGRALARARAGGG